MFSFGTPAGTSNNSNSNPSAQTSSSGFQFGQSSSTGIGASTGQTIGTGGNSGSSGLFSFGTQAANSGTGTGINPSSSLFNYGGSSAPTASSTFPSSTNSYNSPAINSSNFVSSMSTYPFQYIQQCFDPNHLNYRFRAFFYNVADDLTEAQRQERQIQKPVNISDSLWTQVQNDNPDPSRMVPVLANGFVDLHARSRWEDDVIRAHTDKLSELHEKTSKLLRDLDIDLTAKLIAAQQRHQSLSLRLLKIMKGMEVLRRSGTKLSASESQALTKLKASLAKMSNGPLESGSLHNLTFQLDSLLESGRLDAFRSAKAIQPANDESSTALHSLLQDQQDGIKSVVDSLQKDSSDLQVIKSGYRPL